MYRWWIWAGTIIGIAVIGLISISLSRRLNPQIKCKISYQSIRTNLQRSRFFQHRFLFWVAILSAYLWGLGALAQVNIDKYATEYLHVSQEYVAVLIVCLSLGLALGSLLAGRLSRGKIELGLVPIGALFIALFCILLYFTPEVTVPSNESAIMLNTDSTILEETVNSASMVQITEVASPFTTGFIFGAIGLFLLGISGGLYDVPLLATLQMKSPPEFRCRIIAAYNFVHCGNGHLLSPPRPPCRPALPAVDGQKIGSQRKFGYSAALCRYRFYLHLQSFPPVQKAVKGKLS